MSMAEQVSSVETTATIQPIEEASRRRIVAGQAVFDLSSATKELVDNAIDANSKNINIRLFNQGIDIVEVSDDGCGVPMESRPYLATPHATSKIRSFEDIYSSERPHTMGFRGEALFCLANLSRELVVATRTSNEPLAQKMSFARDGSLLPHSVEVRPKKIGTTVAVVGLLEAVPVRRSDMIRRIAEQRRKVLRLISGYAVFSLGVGFRLIDITTTSSQNKKQRNAQPREHEMLATPSACKTLSDTISAVFGSQFYKTLMAFEVDLTELIEFISEEDEETETKKPARPSGETTTPKWQVSGYISKSPDGLRNRIRDEQLYSINKRPVDLPRFSRMFNEVWRSLCPPSSARSHPSFILEFTLPNHAFDINVSPDKREVILPCESELLELLQDHVKKLWSSQIDGHFSEAPSLTDPQEGNRNSNLCTLKEENHQENGDAHNKFNRRYAFSHDMNKMRLQHEFDDGRVLSPLRSKKLSAQQGDESWEISEDLQDTEMGQEMDDTSKSLEAVSLAQESLTPVSPPDISRENEASSKTSPSPTLPEKRSITAVSDRSPNEDRLWRAAKRRLHETSASDIRKEEGTFFDQFRAPSKRDSVLLDSSQNRSTAAPVVSTTQSLESFGFRSSRQKSAAPRQPRRSPLRDESQGQFKRVSFDSAAPFNGYVDLGDDQERLQITRRVSTAAASACTKSSANSQEECELPVLCTPGDGEKGNESHEHVVWSDFVDTQEVISAVRKERLSMHDRRISIQGSEADQADEEMDDMDDQDESTGKISLQKADFKAMEIIGQFNMGFILAKSSDHHLWIMDQHACDEKFNFEKLVAETVIHEQPLIAPMSMELSHAEEACVLDNMNIFEKNGFRFQYQANNPPRHRLSLTAIPHSGARDGRKAVQFGKADVTALCAILGADDTGTTYDATAGSGTGADGSGIYGNNAVRRYVGRSDNAESVLARLPKAIAMFANRACRQSIMIGTALSPKEMERVVKRLGDIDHPWNCPHGRPTMQHGGKLGPLVVEDERRAAEHIAGPTITMMTQEIQE